MKYIIRLLLVLPLLLNCSQTHNKPTVVLTFDDAEASHYTNAAPLLKQYNFGATFYICEFPHKNPEDSILYMTWPQIKALHDMGFEIGNHTAHHKNVTKLTPQQVTTEIRYIEEKCKTYGIPKPVTFAYPGNRTDSLAQTIIAQLGYKFARAGGSRLYQPQNDVAMAIPSYTTSSSEKLVKRVTKALHGLKPNDIIVLTFHGIPDTGHPDYSTTPEFFGELLTYMHQNNYNVIAMRDLDKYTTN